MYIVHLLTDFEAGERPWRERRQLLVESGTLPLRQPLLQQWHCSPLPGQTASIHQNVSQLPR